MDKSIINIVAIGLIMITTTWIVAATWLRGRGNNMLKMKKDTIKVAVSIVVMCLLLGASTMQYMHYTEDAPAEVENEAVLEATLMQEKFDSVKEYTFIDHGANRAYTVPNPLPECPFVLTGIDENNQPMEITINDYEELPALLDTVWYWYGTQSLSEDYYMLTFGDVCSTGIVGETQTFFMFDKDDKLVNIYTASLPVEKEGYLAMGTTWLLPMTTLCAALIWITLRNVIVFFMRRRELKEAQTVRKGGRR